MTDALPRADWSFPTRIRFGVGRIAELPEACRALGMTRPLLVTDPGLAKLPMIAAAVARNVAARLPTALFSGLRPNPLAEDVTRGAAAFKAGGHDGVIAFGGGSSLDTGKAIAFMAVQRYGIEELTVASFQDFQAALPKIVTAGLAPVVSVATTSGTGSEIGRSAAIIDPATRTKKGLFHERMMPGICIADPELTAGLSPALTAAVGMDALSHSLEAYCCPFYHPIAEGAALHGMALVKEWLPRAVADGRDLMARSQMMTASLAGATAFQKGVGGLHALSHPLSSVHDVHHGFGNAVLMPYMLAFNRKAIADKLTALARYLDLPRPSPKAVIDWVLRLREQIGIPHTLGALGITAEHADVLAPMAALDIVAGENPVPFTAKDARRIYARALAGRV
ncbi:MAG: iron-containing alcohol dehydrogenase [Alphaproteobacteria bacterium]|nr:iron-containing alcohol dehydrogenase [Alphaproteobacteria bacterium]